MRLWSIHPQYLDRAGLLACWREALLAKKVLQGQTKGYKNHPQLNRFKNISEINAYLFFLHEEAVRRNYKFDQKKIKKNIFKGKIKVKSGQFKYEFDHLLKKLRTRDKVKYKEINNLKIIKPHPLFIKVSGGVEDWEKI